MKLVSDFDRLKPLLRRVIAEGSLTQDEGRSVDSFRTSSAYTKLPRSATEATATKKEGLFILRKTADVLHALSNGEIREALDHAHEALELNLVGDPFDGAFYRLAARVATLANDEVAQVQFSQRFDVYQQQFGEVRALRGLAALHNPEVEAWLDDVFEPQQESRVYIPKPTPPFVGFQPAARGTNLPEDWTVPVKVLLNTEGLDFISFETTLSVPREDIFDLELALTPVAEARAFLTALETKFLPIRFIFGQTYYDFTAEYVSIYQNILSFEFIVPELWPSDVLLEQIWREISSIILYPGEGHA